MLIWPTGQSAIKKIIIIILIIIILAFIFWPADSEPPISNTGNSIATTNVKESENSNNDNSSISGEEKKTDSKVFKEAEKYSSAYMTRSSKKSYEYLLFEKDSNTVLRFEVYKKAIDGDIDHGTYTGDINSEIVITYEIFKDPVRLRKNGDNWDWVSDNIIGQYSTITYEKTSPLIPALYLIQ